MAVGAIGEAREISEGFLSVLLPSLTDYLRLHRLEAPTNPTVGWCEGPAPMMTS